MLPAQADRLEPLLEVILATGKPLLNIEFHDLTGPPPGTARFLMSNYYPVKNEFIFGINMTVVDITEHKATAALQQVARDEIAGHARQLETEVGARTSDLKASVDELEAFSYSLSHDLRAPMRAIHSFTELVFQSDQANLSSASRGYLTKVMDAAHRADQLIQDVLTISRLSHKELPLEPVNIEKLLHTLIIERTDWQITGKVAIEIAGPLLPVQGNVATLSQCLTNLLENALKFVAPGVRPHVRIWTEAAGAQVRFWIADNGIGIRAEDQSRIFHIFSQCHSMDAYQGTGIGLAIVQRAVERMGGSVGVVSEPGHGSQFWLLLPKAEE